VALRAKNKLTARKLLAGGFSKDGAQVYGIVRNTEIRLVRLAMDITVYFLTARHIWIFPP
jgi:hypothetical protein